MKKPLYLFAFIIFLFNSCAKKTEYLEAPGNMAGSKALENTKWKLTAETSIVEQAGRSNITRNDFIDYDPCELDDIIIYKPNNIVAMDQGPEKCFDSDPQLADVGIWTLSTDEKTLKITSSDGNLFGLGPLSLKVIQLDSRILKYEYFYIINNVKTTTTSTYTKVN